MSKFTARILVLLVLLFQPLTLNAQPEVISCDDVIQAEFTREAEGHLYIIDLAAGDQLRVYGSTIGDAPKFALALYDASGKDIVGDGKWDRTNIPSIESPILGANGRYTLVVANTIIDSPNSWGRIYKGGLGVYNLTIECVKAAGTGSGRVQPGLNLKIPTDFTAAAPVTLQLGALAAGTIPVDGASLSNYTFNGNEGDLVDLTIERLSGNLNLGIVVLTAENDVVFQASLIRSGSLSTRLDLPVTGQYTVGIYRTDLTPVASPSSTAFTLIATLNP